MNKPICKACELEDAEWCDEYCQIHWEEECDRAWWEFVPLFQQILIDGENT